MVVRPLVLLAVLLASGASSAPAAQRFIPYMQPGDALPPIPLIAQDTRPFTFANLRGNAVAVSFIYTRCREARMCPLVSAKFAQAQAAIGSAPIRLVLLTLDPSFDTPAILARYGRGFGQIPRYWTLAGGSPAAIGELAARFGIASATTAPGSIAHTEAVVIIGPDGRVARTIEGNDWSPGELIAAARAALPGQADPLIALRTWLGSAIERCGAAGGGLGGATMLWILGLALAAVGSAFWLAFGNLGAGESSTKP